MKKLTVLLLCLYGTFCFTISESISKEKAIQMAKNFFNSQLKDFQQNIIIDSIIYKGQKTLYVVHFSDSCWAVISADDRTKPIIGYSTNSKFRLNDVNISLKQWIDQFGDEIISVKKSTLKKSIEWSRLEKGHLDRTKSITNSIDPIIKANWGQTEGWNKFCPIVQTNPEYRALVGCAAVATGQAMSVFKYPKSATGSHSYYTNYGVLSVDYANSEYKWDLMSLTSADNYNSMLLYHLGIGMDMEYGASSSSAWPRDIVTVLKNYFKYSKSIKYIYKSSYSETNWENVLINELSNKRPIIYVAYQTSAGHAFNIDGYDGNGFFHVNWGWSGQSNGYFTLNTLYGFNLAQSAIIGIVPLQMNPTNISLSSSIIEEGLPINTFIAKILVEDPDDTNHTISIKNYDSSSNHCPFFIRKDSLFSNAVLKTGEEYQLLVKAVDKDLDSLECLKTITVVENASSPKIINPIEPIYMLVGEIQKKDVSSVFSDNVTTKTIVYEKPEAIYSTINNDTLTLKGIKTGDYEIILNGHNNLNQSISDTIKVVVSVSTAINSDSTLSKASIYPNPAENKLFIKNISGSELKYSIFDSKGVCIKKDCSISENYIDISDLKSQVYVIQIKNNGKMNTMKFLKK